MERLENDKLFQFNPTTLNDVRKMYNLDKPGEMDNAIDILAEWIKKQNHFIKKDYDRRYLEIAIILNKGSIERAKTRLDRLCTFRTLNPHFFGDYDIRTDFKELDGILKQVPMPRLTEDNHRVTLLRNTGKKFEPNFLLAFFRCTFMFAEHLKTRDYIAGLLVVLDYREVNLMELAAAMSCLELLQQGMAILTEAYGLRVKGMHIISSSKLVETIVSIFKRVFSEKIAGRLMVHKDLESLYKYVPRDVLPEEYGGTEKSLDAIYDDWIEVLSSQKVRDYIKEMSEAKTDESRRQKDTFNDQYMGMPGTFRTLNVD